MKITFQNDDQDEDLQDFPVLIILNSSRIDYSHVNDDGSDIRFYDADGTPLSYEIEEWNEDGDSYIWVRVPQIEGDSDEDYIWLYYGNPTATDAQSPGSVWSNNYEGVWHMGNHLEDETGNDHDGTANGTAVDEGQISTATEFTDLLQHVDVGNFNISPSGDDNNGLTIEAWFKVDNFWANDLRIISKADGHDKNNHYWMLGTVKKDDKKRLRFYLRLGDHTQELTASSGNLNSDHWYYAVATYDGSKIRLYKDGDQVGSKNKSGSIATNSQIPVWIGSNPLDHYKTLDGWIDEVRISTVARSRDWIRAQYLAMKDEFCQYGSEQEVTGAGSGTLTNFPVLVVLNSSRINYDETLDNGEDIRFTTPDGTVLPYEIEEWNESGNSYVWVKVPSISSGSDDEFIYMYYANPHATDWQDAEEVWSDDFRAVWHFNNASLSDVSGYDNNGNNNGTQDGTGKIGHGRVFDGNAYIEVPHDNSLNLSDMTFEVWLKRNGDNSTKGIFEKGTGNQYRLKLGQENRVNLFVAGYGDYESSSSVANDEWTYIVATYVNSSSASDQIKIYYNGDLVGSSDFGWGTPTLSNSSLLIGSLSSQSPNTKFNGVMDEIRFSSTVRPLSWIQAQYKVMTDQFITYGSPENVNENSLPGNTAGNQWTVCGAGGDFTTIQAAINDPNVQDGDTILICPGTYNENPIVDKSLVIMGEDSSTVVVNSTSNSKPVFTISADNVTLAKITIKGSASVEAIRLSSNSISENSTTTIRGNIITECRYGIRSYGNSLRGKVIILNNSATNLNDDFVYLYGHSSQAKMVIVKNNDISPGTVYNNTYGVYTRYFRSLRVIDNKFSLTNDNSYGVYGYFLDSLFVHGNNGTEIEHLYAGVYAKYVSDYVSCYNNQFPNVKRGIKVIGNTNPGPDVVVRENDLRNNLEWAIYCKKVDTVRVVNNDCYATGSVYQAYGSISIQDFYGVVTVDSNTIGPNSIDKYGIQVKYGQDVYVYLRLNDLKGLANKGIYLYNLAGNIYCENNDIDSSRYGFYQVSSNIDYLRVSGNDFSSTINLGLYAKVNNADSVFVLDNLAYAAAGAYQSNGSIYIRNPRFVKIAGNTVGPNKTDRDAIKVKEAQHLVVENNTGIYGSEDFVDAENIHKKVIIRGNVATGNRTGIEVEPGSPDSIRITNNLLYNNSNHGIYIKDGKNLLIKNNTIDNCNKAIYFRNQKTLIRNNILSNNNYGIYRSSGNKSVSITYNDLYNNNTDYHNVSPGVGNIDVDPFYVDPAGGDYHLQSTFGSYHGGSWTPDANMSACIDAGDSLDSYLQEPYPNGGRINMGAYGNTDEASLSADINLYTFPNFPRQIYVFLGLPAHPTDGTPAGDPAGIVGDDFGGTPGDYYGWRVSRWNSIRRTYDRYQENDWDPYEGVVLPDTADREPPDFSPGLGFWVLQNAQDNPTLSFHGYEVNPNENYEIELVAPTGEAGPDGFNQLANPLNKQLDWSSCLITDGENTLTIQEAADSGWINKYAYTYNWQNNYYQIIDPDLPGDVINIWDGFWCTQLVDSLDLTLLVPPSAGLSRPLPENKIPEKLFAGKTTFARVPQYTEGWFLQLVGEQVDGKYKDVYSGIGVHPQASDRFDQYDAYEQPVPATELVEIFFPHNWPDYPDYWEDHPEVLSYDIRGNDLSEKKWWFFVFYAGGVTGDFAITWPNIGSVPGQIKFSLYDGYSGELLVSDLRASSSYRFNTSEAWNYFWISAEIVPDETAPDFFVGFLQNPLVTSDLDLYILPSEKLAELDVSVIQPDNTMIYLVMNDELNNIYSGKYRLAQSGTFSVRVEGADYAGNRTQKSYTFTSELLKPSRSFVLNSPDGVFQVEIPEGSSPGQFYLLLQRLADENLTSSNEEAAVQEGSVYSVSPGTRRFKSPVTIRFRLDITNQSEEELVHYGIAQESVDGWKVLPSTVLPQERVIEAQVKNLGKFKLFFDREKTLATLLPDDYYLSQNYPNPFNMSTTIEYGLPQEARVEIVIYNLLGKEIRRLVDEKKKPGKYKVIWDGRDNYYRPVASGTYLVRMKTEGFTAIKKLTIIE